MARTRLAWRVKSNLRLPVQQMLPDGSYLSTIFDSADRALRSVIPWTCLQQPLSIPELGSF